jgi:septum site-determining protein MinC
MSADTNLEYSMTELTVTPAPEIIPNTSVNDSLTDTNISTEINTDLSGAEQNTEPDIEQVNFAVLLPHQQVHLQTQDQRLLLILPLDNTEVKVEKASANDSDNDLDKYPENSGVSIQEIANSLDEITPETETSAEITPTVNNTFNNTWGEIKQQLTQKLRAGERFWQANTEVELVAFDRLLDVRQLQEIAEILGDATLQLKRVNTTRRQTAIAAATVGYSVEQSPPQTLFQPAKGQPLADPIYLQMTARSGTEIRHGGTVILMGDLNAGGSIIADGDIIVLGRLRGFVHAGASGNQKSVIMALQMEPTLIRIADQVARGPQTHPNQIFPEIAYISEQGIRISRFADFSKLSLLPN